MIEQVTSLPNVQDVVALDHERLHYNKVAERVIADPMVLSEQDIRRYDRPPENTVFPLEYAFHLLGDLRGKTIVDLGCGEGINTVILASLGARVLSVDISEVSLEVTGRRVWANGVEANVTLLHSDAAGIPVRDGITDHVLSSSVLHHLNPVLTARQIRRILRPGGTAVFKEPLAGPIVMGTMKLVLPDGEGVTRAQRPLTIEEIEAVSRAVGRPGRRRAFWMTTRLLHRVGLEGHAITTASQLLDASLIRRFPSIRRFASPLVWEACKES